jgi:putative serine protease PepD
MITSPEELIVTVRSLDVGESVVVTYTRDGKSASVTLVLTAGK